MATSWCRNNSPIPTGKRGIIVRLGFLVVPQMQPIPLKKPVSLDALLVLQFPSPKYTVCFWKLWVKNGVKWNNNMCCDALVLTSGCSCPHSYSQETAEGICCIHEGLMWYLPCRHLLFGVERSSPPCLGHASVALCLTDQCFTVAPSRLKKRCLLCVQMVIP